MRVCIIIFVICVPDMYLCDWHTNQSKHFTCDKYAAFGFVLF